MVGEVVEYLAIRPSGTYLDATTGLGGHAEAILSRLTDGKLIANDRDAESLELARKRLEPWKQQACFLHGAFADLETGLAKIGAGPVNGLIADLGVSYWQLTHPERGFSFQSDAPLDMRMDRSQELTAADLINTLAERELADLIYNLGEERRHVRKLARAIVRARPLQTARRLAAVIEAAVPRAPHQKLHPATRVFMALRLAVNRELEELDTLLEALPRLVGSGGRAVFLTFHSLEDRKVKRAFQALARGQAGKILTKHVVRPGAEEVRENPPSRSAKLRAFEMN